MTSITSVPTPNLYCRHLNDDLLKFECQDFIGGRIDEVELVKSGNRYVVKGCEHLGVHRVSGEPCALPARSS